MNLKYVLIRYLVALVIVSPPLQSQEPKQLPPLESQALKSEDRNITKNSTLLNKIYIPPSSAKKTPKWTEGGGSRGLKKSLIQLTLLSPSHVALTTRTQPTLYWHLSEDSEFTAIFTLIEFNETQPLLETQIQESATMGFHAIQLKDYGIELQTNKTYEWSISLIKDRQSIYSTSSDIVEKAFLKHITAPSLTSKNLTQKNKQERALIYAKNGIWYESLEMLMGKSPNNIKNKEILELRTKLLEQVELTHLK